VDNGFRNELVSKLHRTVMALRRSPGQGGFAITVSALSDRPPAGRPLDSSRDEALRRAALELIGEIGYDRLTIDAVAARARAGKATVYRRWPGKAELVADAFLADTARGLETPDTGRLRTDLLAMAEYMWQPRGDVCRVAVMAGMMSALLANPDLRQAFQSAARPPASIVSVLIARAVERGEIPPPDHLELLGMVMPSMCMFRFVQDGTPPDRAFFEAVIDRIVLPALHPRTDAEGKPDVHRR